MIKVHRNTPSKHHLVRVTFKRFEGSTETEIIKAEPVDEVEGESFTTTFSRAIHSTGEFNLNELDPTDPDGLKRKKYYDKDKGKYYILVQNIHKTDDDDVIN